MADTKFSALTAASAALGTMELGVNDGGVSKKVTLSQVFSYLQIWGMPRVTRVNSQHSISSVTGTEVTDLQQTLEAGTYAFRYSLLVRSATSTVSPMLGINFTGTGSPRMVMSFADGSTGVTAELHVMDDQGSVGFGFISGMAQNAESTTTPNMGSAPGVGAINSDIPVFIDGIIIVTGSGDLELWHGSETATATSVEVGSSLVVIRTA